MWGYPGVPLPPILFDPQSTLKPERVFLSWPGARLRISGGCSSSC